MISNKQYKHKNNPFNLIINCITALVSSLLFLFLGFLGVLNLQPLYYLNIKWFDLPSRLLVSSSLLKEDYAQIIHYLLPFQESSLSLSIPLTNSSLAIFSDLQYALFILYLATIFLTFSFVLLIILLRRTKYQAFLVAGIVTPVVSITSCSLLLIFPVQISHFLHHFIFGRSFTSEDESFLLSMFPKEYLLQCGGLIILLSLIASFLLIRSYRKQKQKNTIDSLLPKKQNYYYI